jgi:hypothetical protein
MGGLDETLESGRTQFFTVNICGKFHSESADDITDECQIARDEQLALRRKSPLASRYGFVHFSSSACTPRCDPLEIELPCPEPPGDGPFVRKSKSFSTLTVLLLLLVSL